MLKFYKLIIIIYVFCFYIASAEKSPNILWITSEDNNVSWIGAYGNSHVETPHIDQLAEDGFIYTQAYANAPVCAPSRSTWITGIYAISTGTHHMRSRNDIPHHEIPYYPDLLKENGYYVSNANKTDYNIGGREDKDCWDNPNNINWNILEKNEPFFQVVNFYESHESRAQGEVEETIFDPKNIKLKSYHPDLPLIRKNYAKYHDAVKRMDSRVGNVLKELEKSGLDKNTIVIYTSDHGGVLPRSKRYLYSSGLHCPLIIKIPEQFKSQWPDNQQGSTINRLVSFIDMPKTWLALTGTMIPSNLQGRIFIGEQEEEEPQYHYAFRGRMDERIDNARAVHNKRFLYIRNYMPYVPWIQHLEYQWRIKAQVAWEDHVKKGLASAVQSHPFYPKEYTEELYDMIKDPDCIYNVIDKKIHTELISEFRLALRNWQIQIYDAGLIPESEMLNLASSNNITIYEMVRNKSLYPIQDLLDAADLALYRSDRNILQLQKLLSNSNIGIRYWGAIGLLLLDDYSQRTLLIKDSSDEIRAIGAWMLIKSGQTKEGINIFKDMLYKNSYASLTILNILDWVNKDIPSSWLDLESLKYESGKDLDKMRNHLVKKWSK